MDRVGIVLPQRVITLESPGVARAVLPLVMLVGNVWDEVAQRRRDRVHQLVAQCGVCLHPLVLVLVQATGLVEDELVDEDLAHIVQKASHAEFHEPILAPAQFLGQQKPHDGHVDGVLEGIAVVGLDRVEAHDDVAVHQLIHQRVDVANHRVDCAVAGYGLEVVNELLGLEVLMSSLDRHLPELLRCLGNGAEGAGQVVHGLDPVRMGDHLRYLDIGRVGILDVERREAHVLETGHIGIPDGGSPTKHKAIVLVVEVRPCLHALVKVVEPDQTHGSTPQGVGSRSPVSPAACPLTMM